MYVVYIYILLLVVVQSFINWRKVFGYDNPIAVSEVILDMRE